MKVVRRRVLIEVDCIIKAEDRNRPGLREVILRELIASGDIDTDVDLLGDGSRNYAYLTSMRNPIKLYLSKSDFLKENVLESLAACGSKKKSRGRKTR